MLGNHNDKNSNNKINNENIDDSIKSKFNIFLK